MPPRPQALATHHFVGRLLLIYLFDWIVVLGTIGFAGSTSIWVTPNTRPFSINDISIQFPFQHHAKVPTWLLVFCSIIIPGLAIAFLTLTLPSTSQSHHASFTTRQGWKRRLYCLNTAWLGLGLSIAISLLVTNGLKNLLGRPRPDLISRCNIDNAQLANYTIGPGGLLDWRVCQARDATGALDEANVRDGFRSFPSGHCSMSFAGLTYLAIFLAEFVFALPLAHLHKAMPMSAPIVGTHRDADFSSSPDPIRPTEDRETPLPCFSIMAAILVSGLPLLLAAYISSTRYSDYRHHTFDILAGSVLGVFTGYVGWRWYGAWCCAGGGGRVYGLAARMRADRGLEADVEEGGKGREEPEELEEPEGQRDERRNERRDERRVRGGKSRSHEGEGGKRSRERPSRTQSSRSRREVGTAV